MSRISMSRIFNLWIALNGDIGTLDVVQCFFLEGDDSKLKHAKYFP
jgi:hypothetical protein